MADAATESTLLIMIVRNDAALDELFTGMLDVGLTEATVLDARDMGSILRHDMPIFAGLGALLPQTTGCRTVLARISDVQVASLRAFIGEMRPEDQPSVFLVPVSATFGWDAGPT